MNTNFVTIANRIRTYVTVAITALMVYALYVSMSHITHVADWIGVPGWQAKTAFLLVDMPALIGKVLQLKYFSASTKKSGRQMTYFSGSLSLVCNIASGLILGSYGAAAWGAFVVGMFLYLESKIAKIKPAAAVTKARNAERETTTTEAPAPVRKSLKGTTWTPERRAAHEAAKQRKAEQRELEQAFAAASAPVSGA